MGPMMGGFLADWVGLRAVFLITSGLLLTSFLITLFLIKEGGQPRVKKEDKLSGTMVFRSLGNPGLIISLFLTTLTIQLCNGSISPILTLFVRELEPNVQNIAFISGVVAAIPGVSALFSAPTLGKLGDRIGAQRILFSALILTFVLFVTMSWAGSAFQLGALRFLLGFAEGAMMPAVQTMLLRYSSDRVTGRIFGYNQSFMYLGNVVGPLIGSGVSAIGGFRWVFAATAVVVLANTVQLIVTWRNRKVVTAAQA